MGRARPECPSAKWLRTQTKRNVVFAVHDAEYTQYRSAYPWADVLVIPDSLRGHTGKLRKFFIDLGKDPFFFVDDDVRVSLKATPSVDTMFDTLERHLKSGVTMAGIGQQLFSNAAVEKAELINGDPFAVRNKFVSLVYGIDPKPYSNLDLAALKTYEDIALIIHAIQYGGGTLVTYSATHSNVSPGNGGCNAWRTKEIIVEDLKAICAMYPDLCTIRPTENTTHSQYIGIGLRVAWSKIRRIDGSQRPNA